MSKNSESGSIFPIIHANGELFQAVPQRSYHCSDCDLNNQCRNFDEIPCHNLGLRVIFKRIKERVTISEYQKASLSTAIYPKDRGIIQRQKWNDYTRYLIVGARYSVSLDLFDEYNSTFGGTAFIHGLWVEENFRHRGYASEVLSHAERIAKQAGHKSVFLQWFADTPEYVLKWYLRRGYNIKEEEDGNYALLEKIL